MRQRGDQGKTLLVLLHSCPYFHQQMLARTHTHRVIHGDPAWESGFQGYQSARCLM